MLPKMSSMKCRVEWTAWAEGRKARPDPQVAAQRAYSPPKAAAGRLYPLVQLCAAHGLPEPMPEYNFHLLRGWRFDYAFVAQKIAVEVEGGVWRRGGGAHSHPLNIERDMEKYNAAAVLGWRILRVQIGRAHV